ncbi:hypothetical protein [Paraburkholderia caribensis]|uniref:hypothetical protein n=1 Tax=Paraburkholderia caribensis TaxID=75105 RepID=UPI0034D2570D
MPVQPPAKVKVPLPPTMNVSPQRKASGDLKELHAELREAEAYWTRQYRWVVKVKAMTPAQIMKAWHTADEWQLRSLAIQALEVDPMLRLELKLFKDTGGKSAYGEYIPPSETLAHVLAAMVAKHPVRHPTVITRDIANAQNGRAV